MTLLIFYLLLAIGVSFICSILESVLLSLTPAFIAERVQNEPDLGRRLEQLKTDIDQPLAAILSLNTIAHTVGATGVGAQAVRVFENLSVGVISAVLTLMILVFSEIIPKTLGARFWRQLAVPLTPVLTVVMWLMAPLVWMSRGLTRLLAGAGAGPSVSRAEFVALAELGRSEGVIASGEARILQRLMRFREIRVDDVMTPRTVMFSQSAAITVDEFINDTERLRFSRIPIYDGEPDAIIGHVLKSDILLAAAQDRFDLALSELKRDTLSVPESLSLRRGFEMLVERGDHMALVVDEYGTVEGLVTIEDAVETLLGLEIVDETDANRDMRQLAREVRDERARAMGLS